MSSRHSEILKRLQRMKHELARKERRLQKLKRLSSNSSSCSDRDPPRSAPSGSCPSADSGANGTKADGAHHGDPLASQAAQKASLPRRITRSCFKILLSQTSSEEVCADVYEPHEGEPVPERRTFESIDRLLFSDSSADAGSPAPATSPPRKRRRRAVDKKGHNVAYRSKDAVSIKKALDRLVAEARSLLPKPFDPCRELGLDDRPPRSSPEVRSAPARRSSDPGCEGEKTRDAAVRSADRTRGTSRADRCDADKRPGRGSESPIRGGAPDRPVDAERPAAGAFHPGESRVEGAERDVSSEELRAPVEDVVGGPAVQGGAPGDAERPAVPADGRSPSDVGRGCPGRSGTERGPLSFYCALQCASSGTVEAVDVVEGTPACVVAVQKGSVTFWNLDDGRRRVSHALRRRPQRHCVLRGGPNSVYVAYVASGELSCIRYDVDGCGAAEICPGKARGEGERTHLLARLRDSSFATAATPCRGGTEIRLHEMLRDSTWRVRTVGRASSPPRSLVRIRGLPGALLGACRNVAYVWNCDECVLVGKVVLDASPDPWRVLWAGSESGLLFYVAGSADGCRLVALNPSGGGADVVTDYAWPPLDPGEDGKWAAGARVGCGSVAAVRGRSGVRVWNLADGNPVARMRYADAATLALARVDGRGLLAVGSGSGTVLLFVS